MVKHIENAANRNDFMDYDTALSFFRYLLEEAGYSIPVVESAA